MEINKNEIRRIIKARLEKLTDKEKQISSRRVCEKLFTTKQFSSAKNICLYSAMPNEINVDEAISYLLENGINAYLTRVNGEELDLIKLEKGYKCTKNQWNIDEPIGEVFKRLSDIDLIIVPLVAFDKINHRLGHGKGFYDRLLKSLPNAYKIGVAFDCQEFEAIPTFNHDVPLDLIIT